jgi:hypothetical protein
VIAATRRWDDVHAGDEVTLLELQMTATRIVAGAIATRDFMPGDPECSPGSSACDELML